MRLIKQGLIEPYQQALAVSILKTADPDKVFSIIQSMISTSLGWKNIECFHFEISVGATFGIRHGANLCLLKVYGPDTQFAELKARCDFQSWLYRNNYPCPDHLSGPAIHEGLTYSIEAFLDLGRRADGHLLADINLMAEALASLVMLGQSYPGQASLPQHNLLTVEGSPWPKPHNVLFDFDATRQGAEWIDAVGEAMSDKLRSTRAPLMIGHMDWGAKHCRIRNNQISATYDWDSTARFPEALILGSAAVNFAASWYVDGENRPEIEEMMAFISTYLNHSNAEVEIDLLVAQILYSSGYGARCEHAIDAENGDTTNRTFLKQLLEIDLVAEISHQIQKT